MHLKSSKTKYEFYKGEGCEECKDTGYRGRIGIFELMIMNDKLRELVLKNASTAELNQEALKQGMISLRDDGVQKILQGITTLEEVLRATTEDANG